MGAWGEFMVLGTENKIFHHFVCCLSKGKEMDKVFIPKLWTNGFFRFYLSRRTISAVASIPVLYLNDADGITREDRRKMLDKLGARLNEESYKEFGDPEIAAKIQQYELAYRMQTAVPEITDPFKRAGINCKNVWTGNV